MNEATQVLAGFGASARYEDLPEPVREYAKDILLDTLACALAGYKGEETGQIAAFAASLAQSSESSVLGGGKLSLAGATMTNAYLITAVTMCDTYRPSLTHITPQVVPPALAIAERDNASGRDLLLAIAIGCEVTARIGSGLDYPAFRARGWHGPGTIGPFGGAAAAGRLMGFDPDRMAKAFGLAGSQSAGTFAAWGTPTIKFHQCRGALSGLMAALLARQDFLATREFITAKDGGLLAAYSNGGHPEAMTADLGHRWEMDQIALRLWPSASSIQGMNTALFDILDAHPSLRADEIAEVRVRLSEPTFNLHGGLARYKAKFDALISAHYTAAIIVHDRDLSLAQFEASRYDDPGVRRFTSEKVDIRPDPTLSGVQSTAEIETRDGSILSARCEYPRGSYENRLTRAQIESKFRTYARAILPAAAIEDVIQAVADLENVPARRLIALLSPPTGLRSAA